MITPEMSFSKSIKLSIVDLEEAKSFADEVHATICQSLHKSFREGDIELNSDLTANGSYEYHIGNENFSGWQS